MSRLPFIAVLLLAIAWQSTPVLASPEIRARFQELAKRILNSTSNDAVSIGVFSQTDLPDSNAGPGLEQMLVEELNRLAPGIVRDDAKFEIKGDYAFAQSRDPADGDLKVIKGNLRIIEKKFAEETIRFPFTLNHTRTIAELIQFTGSLQPDGSKEERNEDLDKGNKEPKVHIHGNQRTLVSSISDSPYSVELLVKELKNHESVKARPREAKAEKGLAFINIDEDELYEVKVYNASDQPVAVTLSIDGLNVFHFTKDRNAKGDPAYTHHILRPHSNTTIVGWHNSKNGSENYLSFLVTGYGQGAVSKAGIKSRGQVGVIHVQFSHCHELKEGQGARSGNETGFGPPREVKQKVVSFEIEPPHDFVTVRYTRP